MLAPLSWLKDYIDITIKPKELGERLTEIGLGTEKITKTDEDVVFDLEITPNRPDLLSIIGIAREIAAIEGKKVRLPKIKTDLKKIKPEKKLPITIKTDPKINPRFTAIIIDEIKVGESPKWLKDKLIKIGQRPINNIVDITNYVMFELGNPIHAFDYDKIAGHIIQVELAKGGEKFTSVDGVTYHLPKDALIIKDAEKVIDLCGIKGGENTGTYNETKTILIRVPVELPQITRRTSQHLGLRSEASAIFERGVNAGGTLDALTRTVDLVLELAGGQIASDLIDVKPARHALQGIAGGKDNFEPWKLKLNLERLNKILGIYIPQKKVLSILESLNLSPKIVKDTVEVMIPTYRNDLKIEEDLIEEVARLYGYNKFPKTIPQGRIPTPKIPYFRDYRIDEIIKNYFISAGFSEIYTYSLIGEKDLAETGINPDKILRVDNPVSREYEYLRPTLKTNLLKAFRQNKPNFTNINLFELGKVYLGKNLDEAKETYYLSGISNEKNFLEIKGLLERLFSDFGVKEEAGDLIEAINEGVYFEINYDKLVKKANFQKTYKPIPKYPGIVEDIALKIPANTKTGDIIKKIKEQSSLIIEVSLLDEYQDTKTFHIVYQHKDKNLTNEEVKEIRKKILEALEKNLNIEIK